MGRSLGQRVKRVIEDIERFLFGNRQGLRERLYEAVKSAEQIERNALADEFNVSKETVVFELRDAIARVVRQIGVAELANRRVNFIQYAEDNDGDDTLIAKIHRQAVKALEWEAARQFDGGNFDTAELLNLAGTLGIDDPEARATLIRFAKARGLKWDLLKLTNGIVGNSDNSAIDTILRKYDADRSHELELNKFTHTFEVERLKLLQILNGGAFVALATITGHEGIFPDLPSKIGMGLAVLAWLVGLERAFSATQTALDAQVCFEQAYHKRRRATEWRLLGDTHSTEELEQLVTRPPMTHGPVSGDVAFDREAAAKAKDGRKLGESVKSLAKASLYSFIIGALLLLGALLLNQPTTKSNSPYIIATQG